MKSKIAEQIAKLEVEQIAAIEKQREHEQEAAKHTNEAQLAKGNAERAKMQIARLKGAADPTKPIRVEDSK